MPDHESNAIVGNSINVRYVNKIISASDTATLGSAAKSL